MGIRMQKDHIRTLKILLHTLESGGLWKHKGDPARSKRVRAFRVQLDTVWPTEEEDIGKLRLPRFPAVTIEAQTL